MKSLLLGRQEGKSGGQDEDRLASQTVGHDNPALYVSQRFMLKLCWAGNGNGNGVTVSAPA